MSARTFDIFRTMVFLTVICVLCSYIHRPYNEADRQLADYYRLQDNATNRQINDDISSVSYEMHEPGNYDKVYPYYKVIMELDSTTKAVRTLFSHVPLKAVYADNLQQQYKNYIDKALGCLPRDSESIRESISGVLNEFSVFDGKDGRWLHRVLTTQSESGKELLFACLSNNIHTVERVVVDRVTEYSHVRWCGYDSVGVLPVMDTKAVEIGSEIKCGLMLCALPFRGFIAEHHNVTSVSRYGKVGLITENAGGVGEYTIQGFSRCFYGYEGQWDTLPWSFKYRVIGKGASLILGAHQYCYRYVPNPITVSIPGYPPGKIKLWAKQAKLVHREGAQWEIIVTDTSLHNIIVYADATDVHGHTATVHAAEYAIKDLNGLRLTIDGSEPTTMPAADILKGHSIQATDGVSGFTLRVISYDLVIINAKNKEVGTFYINKNLLDPDNAELKKALSSLTPGAHIYFCNVLTEHNISIPGAGITVE